MAWGAKIQRYRTIRIAVNAHVTIMQRRNRTKRLRRYITTRQKQFLKTKTKKVLYHLLSTVRASYHRSRSKADYYSPTTIYRTIHYPPSQINRLHAKDIYEQKPQKQIYRIPVNHSVTSTSKLTRIMQPMAKSTASDSARIRLTTACNEQYAYQQPSHLQQLPTHSTHP